MIASNLATFAFSNLTELVSISTWLILFPFRHIFESRSLWCVCSSVLTTLSSVAACHFPSIEPQGMSDLYDFRHSLLPRSRKKKSSYRKKEKKITRRECKEEKIAQTRQVYRMMQNHIAWAGEKISHQTQWDAFKLTGLYSHYHLDFISPAFIFTVNIIRHLNWTCSQIYTLYLYR